MRKLIFHSVLAALILSACNAAATSTPAIPATPTLEVTNSAHPIEVNAGSEFTIVVRTNIASGYHWEVAEQLDTRYVDYVWKDYIPDNIDLPNLGGKDVWRFKAIAPGQTTISLGYYYGETLDLGQLKTYTIVVK